MKIQLVLYVFPIFGILSGMGGFMLSRKHMLNMLLSLEFLMVNLFWLMVLIMSNLGSEVYLSLFFLTLAACEGALGLALLVSVVRGHGSDSFKSFSVLRC